MSEDKVRRFRAGLILLAIGLVSGCVSPQPGTPNVLFDADGNAINTEDVGLILSDPTLTTEDQRRKKLEDLGLTTEEAQYCIDENVGNDAEPFTVTADATLTEPEVSITSGVFPTSSLVTVTLLGLNTTTSCDKTWLLGFGETKVVTVPPGRYYYEVSVGTTQLAAGRATFQTKNAYAWTIQ